MAGVYPLMCVFRIVLANFPHLMQSSRDYFFINS
uniref:Uncharacterized protein n=1 Tax=Heterorhabditis bacteriophora TaxID=37862 RepID=A0A1I7WCG1_HETBA